MNVEKKDILTISEFAFEIRVHPNTVRKMIRIGRLNAFKAGGGKTSAYRIARSEIHRLSIIDLQGIVQNLVNEKINLDEK